LQELFMAALSGARTPRNGGAAGKIGTALTLQDSISPW
jgi:hypothetical protein